MTQDLFFEVRRNKSHVYLDADENQTVLDLKKMLAAIEHVSFRIYVSIHVLFV